MKPELIYLANKTKKWRLVQKEENYVRFALSHLESEFKERYPPVAVDDFNTTTAN